MCVCVFGLGVVYDFIFNIVWFVEIELFVWFIVIVRVWFESGF